MSVSPGAPAQKKRGGPKAGVNASIARLNKERRAKKIERASAAYDLRSAGASYDQIKVHPKVLAKSAKAVGKLIAYHHARLAAVPAQGLAEYRGVVNASIDDSDRRIRRAMAATPVACSACGAPNTVLAPPDAKTTAMLERELAHVRDQRIKLNGLAVMVESKVIVEREHENTLAKLRDRLRPEVFEEVLAAMSDDPSYAASATPPHEQPGTPSPPRATPHPGRTPTH